MFPRLPRPGNYILSLYRLHRNKLTRELFKRISKRVVDVKSASEEFDHWDILMLWNMTLIYGLFTFILNMHVQFFRAWPVERGEKDRGTKGKLEAPLTSTCFLIGGPQIFFVRWCNVYVFYFSVWNGVWLFTFVLWPGGGYLGKITAGYVSHKRVLKQNLEKINQNLRKSLSKGSQNIKRVGFWFLFRIYLSPCKHGLVWVVAGVQNYPHFIILIITFYFPNKSLKSGAFWENHLNIT